MHYHHAVNSPVAVVEGIDKFQALDEALEKSEFFDFLRRRTRETGKEPSQLRIAVKPNLMMFVSRKEMGVVTDPELVEHLLLRLEGEGYTNHGLVESQNVYSNWYAGREVNNVAREAGYSTPFLDLTEAPPIACDHPLMGSHRISSALYDMDVLVSFAKSKTHIASLVTLGIKNCFGLTWEQDKYAHYHGRWGASFNHALLATITDPAYPFVKNRAIFTIVDAWTSLDGFLGFKSARWEIPNPCRFAGYGSLAGTPVPLPKTIRINLAGEKETRTILAGEDLMRVERVGMIKMGVPHLLRKVNFPYWIMARHFGEPEVDRIPIIEGTKNQGKALRPYDQPERRYYSIGYSGVLKVHTLDWAIPWSAKVLEHFYFSMNIVSSYAPMDDRAFPKKSYFKTVGKGPFRIALPSKRLGLLFLKTLKTLAGNITRIADSTTFSNLVLFFTKRRVENKPGEQNTLIPPPS